MTLVKDYKFFRSFSAKIENWNARKAETFWQKLRERKITGRQTAQSPQYTVQTFRTFL